MNLCAAYDNLQLFLPLGGAYISLLYMHVSVSPFSHCSGYLLLGLIVSQQIRVHNL